jgi:tartrate dehydratase alpha subunit/fumarate hydratase class I-like protein
MCQDTGTAIIMGKKGRKVWTDGDDEAALGEGVADAYFKRNLRYSQVAAALDVRGEEHRDEPAGADRHLC